MGKYLFLSLAFKPAMEFKIAYFFKETLAMF